MNFETRIKVIGISKCSDYAAIVFVKSKIDIIRNIAEGRVLWLNNKLASQKEALNESTEEMFESNKVVALITPEVYADILKNMFDENKTKSLNHVLDIYKGKSKVTKKFLGKVISNI